MSELHELLQADKASPTVFHHLMVPEPHDAVPLRRDRAGPLGIRLGPLARGVVVIVRKVIVVGHHTILARTPDACPPRRMPA